jgi:aryl-alcohol dehydrogenase-like predicted oxidoreductase
VRSLAAGLKISVATLALLWVVQQQGVTAAIAGSRNPRHVRANAEAEDLQLSSTVLEELDEAFGRE